jgi:hypothetical protein
VADRRLRYPLLWLLFGAVMVTGAGLLLARDPALRTWGLVLLASPVLGFSLIGLAYYLVERVRARPPR